MPFSTYSSKHLSHVVCRQSTLSIFQVSRPTPISAPYLTFGSADLLSMHSRVQVGRWDRFDKGGAVIFSTTLFPLMNQHLLDSILNKIIVNSHILRFFLTSLSLLNYFSVCYLVIFWFYYSLLGLFTPIFCFFIHHRVICLQKNNYKAFLQSLIFS